MEAIKITVYETILFYSCHGYDPAICDTETGNAELQRFFDYDQDDYAILQEFYNSLLDGHGFRHTQREFKSTGIEDKYPVITGHLILSVYS